MVSVVAVSELLAQAVRTRAAVASVAMVTALRVRLRAREARAVAMVTALRVRVRDICASLRPDAHPHPHSPHLAPPPSTPVQNRSRMSAQPLTLPAILHEIGRKGGS